MTRRTYALAILGAAFASIVGVSIYLFYDSSQTHKAVAACDTLTASTYDSTQPSSLRRITFDALDPEHAIPACYFALTRQPRDARLRFQYGRALDAGKQGSRAIAAYKESFDTGFALAANNLGSIYQEGRGGVAIDSAEALQWYEIGAEKGVLVSKKGAAGILERGEGLPTPDISRAAKYWRELATTGDAEASEKVGLAIINRSIQPTDSAEAVARLMMAADKGRFNASLEYANLLHDSERSIANVRAGAKYSLSAYRIAIAAPINTEDAWLLNQRSAFNRYRDFMKLGAENLMPPMEYSAASVDFPAGSITKFTVPVLCGNEKTPFDFYIWQWSRSYPQTDPQAEWLKQARRCIFPQEVIDSFRRLMAIAIEHKQDFPSLAKYAMGTEPASTSKPPAEPSAVVAQSAPSTTNDQVLRSMQEAESRRAVEDRQRHEENLRAVQKAAKQQCEAEKTICDTQCALLRGSRDSDPWYSISPRTKCEIKCMLIKCE